MNKMLTKALAPVALKTAEKSAGDVLCYFIFKQPQLPKKLMNTVK